MSKNVLVLGAAGGIARVATVLFLAETDVRLTLYLRNTRRLMRLESDRVRVVEGDVLDAKKLAEAMAGQEVAYANLAGDLERTARGRAARERGLAAGTGFEPVLPA